MSLLFETSALNLINEHYKKTILMPSVKRPVKQLLNLLKNGCLHKVFPQIFEGTQFALFFQTSHLPSNAGFTQSAAMKYV